MNVLKRAFGGGRKKKCAGKPSRPATAEWGSDDEEPSIPSVYDDVPSPATAASPDHASDTTTAPSPPPPHILATDAVTPARRSSAASAASPVDFPAPASLEENGREYKLAHGDAGKAPITPLNLLSYSMDSTGRYGCGPHGAHGDTAKLREKEEKIRTCISQGDIDTLRQVCWSGIPISVRPVCWMTLTNYVSSTQTRRATELLSKREVYQKYVDKHFHRAGRDTDPASQKIMSIILKDAPRTYPTVRLFSAPRVQETIIRILYTWAVRHPATGYVQGMNDILTPFLFVYYSGYVGVEALLGQDAEAHLAELSADVVENVEADVFWGFNALLQNIQDHFTEGQLGIQNKLAALSELLRKVNPALHAHLEHQKVHMTDFAYKWVACLFLRELPLLPLLRLWDTYLAEGCYDYPRLHVYVCLALLQRLSAELLPLEFCELMPILLSPPTDAYTETDVSELLSKAYCLQQLYPMTL